MKIQFIISDKYNEDIEYVCDMPTQLTVGERITLSNVVYKDDMSKEDYFKIKNINFKVKETDWRRIDQEVVQVVRLKGELNIDYNI